MRQQNIKQKNKDFFYEKLNLSQLSRRHFKIIIKDANGKVEKKFICRQNTVGESKIFIICSKSKFC